MMALQLGCKQCEQFFTPARLWQKFCSPRCRYAFHKKQQELRRGGDYREIFKRLDQLEKQLKDKK